MKLLLDTCVWGGAKEALGAAGYDVVWIGDWDADPGDEALIALAHREGRVLVTLDKDFGELAIVYRRPHAGIMRLVGIAARQQATYCLEVLKRYQVELEQGAIITVTSKRVRIRTSEIRGGADAG